MENRTRVKNPYEWFMNNLREVYKSENIELLTGYPAAFKEMILCNFVYKAHVPKIDSESRTRLLRSVRDVYFERRVRSGQQAVFRLEIMETADDTYVHGWPYHWVLRRTYGIVYKEDTITKEEANAAKDEVVAELARATRDFLDESLFKVGTLFLKTSQELAEFGVFIKENTVASEAMDDYVHV